MGSMRVSWGWSWAAPLLWGRTLGLVAMAITFVQLCAASSSFTYQTKLLSQVSSKSKRLHIAKPTVLQPLPWTADAFKKYNEKSVKVTRWFGFCFSFLLHGMYHRFLFKVELQNCLSCRLLQTIASDVSGLCHALWCKAFGPRLLFSKNIINHVVGIFGKQYISIHKGLSKGNGAFSYELPWPPFSLGLG